MVTACFLRTAAATLAALALTACSSLGPDESAAGDAALAFYAGLWKRRRGSGLRKPVGAAHESTGVEG